VTHIPTWDGLVELVGHSRFLYVADAKLCSSKAMGHINAHEGRFVTVVPHGRREDVWFRDWVQTHAPEWVEAKVKPGGQNEPDSIWRVFEAPLPSGDGYRVIWVHSSAKHVRDAAARSSRLEKGLAAIEQLEVRLAGPKSRFKTRVAVEEAATSALKDVRAGRWISFDVEEAPSATFHQVRRGRPGPDTRYVRKERPTFHVRAEVRGDVIAFDAATDGCFALVTNDRNLSGVQVLEAYHYQPHLERRHHLLKSAQEMAPMHLENPERIEALLFCHFFALLTEALVEREIRTSMKEQNLSGIALYPELRNCPAPSAPRIFEVFAGLQRHYLMDGDDIAQTFEPELSLVQQQVLELLNVPADVYQSATTD
jgi:transposase